MTKTSAELEKRIDDTVNIPPIPTTLTRIAEVFDSPNGSAKQVASIIAKDPAIANRALRLVNSSFYGLKNPVTNINLACSILGLKVIKNLALQAAIRQTFKTKKERGEFNTDLLWDHSFKSAIACRLLAEHSVITNDFSLDDAYTCGLIHDIGMLIMVDSQSDRFFEALQMSKQEDIPLATAETQLFGFNHAHVVSLFANRWMLASKVQAAVMSHHSPQTNSKDWEHGFLVSAASTYAHMAAKSHNAWIDDFVNEDGRKKLRLTQAQHEEILKATAEASMD